MKVAFIGTYPPRECGIGTFNRNLFNAIQCNIDQQDQYEGIVIAMNDHDRNYAYPDEVVYTIRQNSQEDYLQAAKYINVSGADVCLLQHEFGIYGGENGVYILPLLYRLEIPLVVTIHTILKNPSFNQKAVLQEICKMANRIVVMSHKAIDFLVEIYDIPESKIEYIEHGVPDIVFNQDETKREFRLEGRNLLLTFGLISRNKGIETVIKALPRVIEKHPNLLYIVLGKTHPNVLRHSGEEYRIFLTKLINDLNLQRNVVLINKFVNQKELFKYLHASDIYITPYLNEAQITSGTLAYAVGVGSAVVSTPYWHATELLSDGKGILFDFNNSQALSDILIELLDNPEKRNQLRKKAYQHGTTITWPKTGARYYSVIMQVADEEVKPDRKEVIPFDIMLLPSFSLAHVKRMTDDTGIIQHAKFGIPNLKEGYCLDDNARALLMTIMAIKQKKSSLANELCPVYLSYIHYMQNSDGSFRNMLSFNRSFLDKRGSEDAFGRTIWALGYLLSHAPNDSYYQSGRMIFFNAIPEVPKITAIRAIAASIIGISYYLKSNPSDDGMLEMLKKETDILLDLYEQHSSPGWNWFEQELSYDNAILPLALLHAAEQLVDDRVINTAIESMNFLTEVTFSEGYLSLIGNEKWFRKGGEKSRFAQQPVDAMASVLMFHQAFILTNEKKYLNRLFTSFMWFHGENDLRLGLYDYETEGCCDGLESYGVNRNQGAESTLAYLISYLTVFDVYEEYYKNDQSKNQMSHVNKQVQK
ncbi:MAG TPA: glycosyltransferase family 4 protein [Lentimicrobium sp.]|nr:glycosyltransferase family 4 protein [Lentimicrobium sp.]